MAANAKFIYDAEYNMFLDVKPLLPTAPGSVDRPASIDMMLRFSALVGVFLMVMDMSNQRRWRMRLWVSVAIAGITIALLGLIQKLAGAPMIFWEKGRHGYFFFATYLYHGNAGAFLNLVLPLVTGLTSLVFLKRKHAAMALLMPGLVLCIAAAFSHASKAAMAISILLLVIIALWQARMLWGAGQGLSQKISQMVSASITVIAIVIIVLAAGWHFAAQRWDFFDVSKDARLFAYGICKRMIGEAGAFGFGPGTFSIMFDRYALEENPRLPVFYRHAHQDYLQSLIEWGWIGGLCLGVLLLGGLVIAFWRSLLQGKYLRTSERLLLFSCALSLLGVALHASVDFPLQIYSLQLYTVIFAGLAWSSANWIHQLQFAHAVETKTANKSARKKTTKSRPSTRSLTVAKSKPQKVPNVDVVKDIETKSVVPSQPQSQLDLELDQPPSKKENKAKPSKRKSTSPSVTRQGKGKGKGKTQSKSKTNKK